MKIINIILFCLVCYILPANAGVENVEVKSYIDSLISDGYRIVNDQNLSSDERFKQSSSLIRANLHLDWMAQYSLGRNKKALSAVQIKEFTDVYSKFIVNAYADLSKHYNGEKAIVKNIRKIDGNMFIVNMEIAKVGSASTIKVDYLIHRLENSKQNSYKVADIITEGVSILNSQQSEFNSVISTNGIDGLIADLKEKIAHKEMREQQNK